jgi:hypothetical protein
MSRLWLYRRLVVQSARYQSRTTILAIALIAIATADLVLAVSWTAGAAAVSSGVVVIVAMCSALAATVPTRTDLVVQMRANGASANMTLGIAAIHAAVFGLSGSILGLVLGLIVRMPLIAIAPPGEPTTVTGVIGAALAAGAASTAVATVWVILRTRFPAVAWSPRTRRSTGALLLAACVGALCFAIRTVARDTRTFGDLFTAIIIYSPLLAVGATGLATGLLSGVVNALRRRGGLTWFTARSLRSRARIVPLLAVITIAVSSAGFAAVLTSSLHERVIQATAGVIRNPDVEWAVPSSQRTPALGPDATDAQRTADSILRSFNSPEANRFFNNGVEQPPVRIAPATLADTSLTLQDPAAEWVLVLAALLAMLPLVVVSVALASSTRSREDTLLDLQGAGPGFRRRANALEAGVLAVVGTVTGLLIGIGGTTYGIWAYNDRYRFTPNTTFPPVPLVLPAPIIVAFIVIVPLTVAGLATIVTPSGRHAPWRSMGRTLDQPRTATFAR